MLLQVQYQVDPETATGTCAVCVSKDGSRSLVANLAAANNYKVQTLQQTSITCCLTAAYSNTPMPLLWLVYIQDLCQTRLSSMSSIHAALVSDSVV